MALTAGRELKKETLTPEPNGVRKSFYTSVPYKANSVSIWLNGVKLIKEWDDGFAELGGTEVLMSEPPLLGDSLQAEYEAL